MEQLLSVTTTQTNDLISSFQDRFNNLQKDHKASLHKLQLTTKSQLRDNQTLIEH